MVITTVALCSISSPDLIDSAQVLEGLLLPAEDLLWHHATISASLVATRGTLPHAAESLRVRDLAELAHPLPLAAGYGSPEEGLTREAALPAVVTVTGRVLLAHTT